MFRVEGLSRRPADPAVRRISGNAIRNSAEDVAESRGQENYFAKVTAFVKEVTAAKKAGMESARGDNNSHHLRPRARRTFFQANVEALQSIRLHDSIFEIGADGRIRQQKKIVDP
jgi:hypothetical protein